MVAQTPQIELRKIQSLRPYAGNARVHSKKQVRQIASSIQRFGFTNPVLISDDDEIIAGHGRVMAAKELGLATVPTLKLSHLSPAERRAYVLADNKLALNAGWDNEILAIELQALIDIDFDLSLTGFSLAEVDFALDQADESAPDEVAPADVVPEPLPSPVSRRGDLWSLGRHRLLCGDARNGADYALLLGEEKADLIFTDPPYNVRIDGNVCGLGTVRHREFAMASGEMSRENDRVVEIPLLDAVIRAEAVAALKGSPNAQRSIIEREARYRNELKAEIDADHARWRDYIDTYHKAVSALKKKGEPVPLDWIHPEDIIFKDASHVLFRGGDPAEARRNWQHVVRLRDVHMLQSVKDERYFKGRLEQAPIFLSGLLAMLLNMALPKRMQLDEDQYFLQHCKNCGLKMRELKSRIRNEWIDLGRPEFADTLTPALRPDALERIRAFEPSKT
ncbi:MAG: hypothetical protein QOF14_764 [Hyphomicrobiales bacterium]|jgi:ParB-like chromosome segregation protein Spo0J|nr:hypothetical protein [Hyphomicrobiales bacterium]